MENFKGGHVNRLQELWKYQQSPWYDNLSRQMLVSGELGRLIREDGLRGITSNPTIFDKAISGSKDYDPIIAELARKGQADPQIIFEALAVEDIRRACDLLLPLYRESNSADGFVSLEVAPTLAHDTPGTVQAAKRLFAAVGRPNVMIKVPATLAGIPAIEELIAEGININVTLIFANSRYEAVANAYIAGLKRLAEKGKPLNSVASVASFFVSRIDAAVDKELEERSADQKRAGGSVPYRLFLGRVAIANAKVAYKRFKDLFSEKHFGDLAKLGARPQRLLWASTGTKNPKYRDVMYVEELIGPATVNTIPPATWNAFRDHGELRSSLEEGVQDAVDVLSNLSELGVSLEKITATLEKEGVKAFEDSYSALLKSITTKAEVIAPEVAEESGAPTGSLRRSIQKKLDQLIRDDVPKRLFQKDVSLWKGDEALAAIVRNSLGWLELPSLMGSKLAEIEALVQKAKGAGFTNALLLGMGGSSLAPEVFRRVFETKPGYLKLHVLDSTDPEAILEMDRMLPPEKTLYIVSSKSGTTTEPLRLFDYFFGRVRQKDAASAGGHFVAITDPGSFLEKQAKEKGFLHIFANPPDIGGRYSALSLFGLVPAALMGVDVKALLARAGKMAQDCKSSVGMSNHGLRLGAAIAAMSELGRDKISLLISPELSGIDLWLEQLIAESLGKIGKGIVPVSGEPISDPKHCSKDRIFIRLHLNNTKSRALEVYAPDLERAGHPVIELALQDRLDIGAEFYRWEVATAVLGHFLGVNPFDQPNVQQAKDKTNQLLAQLGKEGSLPSFPNQATEKAGASAISLSFSRAALEHLGGVSGLTVDKGFRSFLREAGAGMYVGLLAYVSPGGKYEALLRNIQAELLRVCGVPVQFGYGPRYLHSTGQLHKGGPGSGIFILVVREDQPKLEIPESRYGFGQLVYAQCAGDFQALSDSGRKAMLVRIHGDSLGALEKLSKMISPVSAAA